MSTTTPADQLAATRVAIEARNRRRPMAALAAAGLAVLLTMLGNHAAGSAPVWLLVITLAVGGALVAAAVGLAFDVVVAWLLWRRAYRTRINRPEA